MDVSESKTTLNFILITESYLTRIENVTVHVSSKLKRKRSLFMVVNRHLKEPQSIQNIIQ